MHPLDDLQLVARSGGYDFVLNGEVLGDCDVDGDRLTRFEVLSDQRRRGIGRRAMERLLSVLPPETRLSVEIPTGDLGTRAFAEAMGFGVTALVYDRRAQTSDRTVEIFRPVGQAEMDLIAASGMRAFPPRLPEQPIFYPVATLEYARLIAKDWNVRDPASGHVGYVLRFSVTESFLERHPAREAGGRDLIEYWIPAEEVPSLNAAVVGLIEIVEKWPA